MGGFSLCAGPLCPPDKMVGETLGNTSNDTTVIVSRSETSPVQSETSLSTICFPMPLNGTWDPRVIHTKHLQTLSYVMLV